MRLFACPNCDQVLFFENTRCTNCGQSVGYDMVDRKLVATPPEAKDSAAEFDVSKQGGKTVRYRKCENYAELDACNWLVLATEGQQYCRSCRLSEVIPDLSDPANRSAWLDIERAKRRLIYTLQALDLSAPSRAEDPELGLTFRFLRSTPQEQVMTGHDKGVITLNVAEADASYRENMREKLGEAYRTVLGHLRHESGHYYWDRLVRGSPSLEAFRKLFGDERQSYEEAVKRHYEAGPPENWSECFISAYATMHPWEDWAETWAHYLHMVDTLETAKSHGLAVRIPGEGTKVATDNLVFADYDGLSRSWHAVTVALNNLCRSMGMKDIYPFVLSPPVQEKLRFVHELIRRGAPGVDAVARKVEDRGRNAPAPSTASSPARVSPK